MVKYYMDYLPESGFSVPYIVKIENGERYVLNAANNWISIGEDISTFTKLDIPSNAIEIILKLESNPYHILSKLGKSILEK